MIFTRLRKEINQKDRTFITADKYHRSNHRLTVSRWSGRCFQKLFLDRGSHMVYVPQTIYPVHKNHLSGYPLPGVGGQEDAL